MDVHRGGVTGMALADRLVTRLLQVYRTPQNHLRFTLSIHPVQTAISPQLSHPLPRDDNTITSVM